MNLKSILEGVEHPAIYERNGKNCYFDPYRKKLIEITPEETVRQKVALYLEKELGVPRDLLWIEVPISYYVEKEHGRADIIVHKYDDNGYMVPLLIVECKNENVLLTDRVVRQALNYSNLIGADYFAVTNGNDFEFYAYDNCENVYRLLDDILLYNEMVTADYSVPKLVSQEYTRYTFEELKDRKILSEYNEYYGVFGNDSEERIASFAVNFHQAVLDESHRLPYANRGFFEMLEDVGKKIEDYGNAGGGSYAGDYREFLVKDRFGNHQTVSVSIFGLASEFHGLPRRSSTSLVVAIDDFKKSHNSLQYNVDRYMKIESGNKKAVISHDGRSGSMKNEDTIKLVREHSTNIQVTGSNILIGSIPMDRVLYLDDPEVAELIYNLIEYALLRDEARDVKKSGISFNK